MNTPFQILPHHLLSPGTAIYDLAAPDSTPVGLQDPANSVYTDFHRTRPFAISSAASLDQVDARMIACGVRLLFVADAGGALQGLVTYTDLYGEKPVRYIREHGGSRELFLVLDVMTPLDRLDALNHADVLRATVGDIVETIRTTGRQHLLVSDTTDDGRQVIVGMFSSTHLEKRADIRIELTARANSFADLERALAG